MPTSSIPMAPAVLFGAFDRHNLGDILLGWAAALAAFPRPCLFAGLAAANLERVGGFIVRPLGEILASWRSRYGEAPVELVHVGGEIFDTDAWEAAVMLLDPGRAREIVARLDADPAGRRAWAAAFLETDRPAPYVLGREDLPAGARLVFGAVGGAGLSRRPPEYTTAIARAASAADRLTVRDGRTRAALAALGIAAPLAPDPVAGLGPWLTAEIGRRPVPGEDYLACQCAASFGDDDSLDALARLLERRGRPVLFFLAGAAPWHDDRAVYERLLALLPVPGRILDSLHVLDIAAAIAGARECLASSLHALLVASLFRVPAVGLERRAGEGEKLRAYAGTWGGFRVVDLAGEAASFRSQDRL